MPVKSTSVSTTTVVKDASSQVGEEEHEPYKPDQSGWQILNTGKRLLELGQSLEPEFILPLMEARKALFPDEIKIIKSQLCKRAFIQGVFYWSEYHYRLFDEQQATRVGQNNVMFNLMRPRQGALESLIEICREHRICEEIFAGIGAEDLKKKPTRGQSVMYRFTFLLYKFILTTYMRWSMSYIHEESVATNINIQNHWVNLKLSKKIFQEGEKDLVDSEYIAEKLDAGVIVIVKGEPGMGKSTLVRKLCHDWMRADPPSIDDSSFEMSKYLKKYSLVLPVEMRSAENLETIFEVALTFLLQRLQLHLNKNEFAQLLHEVKMKAERDEVLIILDALDERKATYCQELQNILTNESYMPPCPLLITTRPELLVEIDAAVEIVNVCGLMAEDQKSFIDVYCKNKDAQLRMKDIIQDDKNSAVKKSAKRPFFLAVLCFLAEKDADLEKDVLPLPADLGRVFFSFLSFSHDRIKKKKIQQQEENPIMKHLAANEVIWHAGFSVIAEMAFDTLQTGGKIISQAELKNNPFIRELCLNMEFLTTGAQESLVFLHEAFQEFFACYHLHSKYFNEYHTQVTKDMYALAANDRNEILITTGNYLQQLYTFRKKFSNKLNCMDNFLRFFDSFNDYSAVTEWNNLDDNGQYINQMNNEILKRKSTADHYDKFKKRLKNHYNERILKNAQTPSQWVKPTFREKKLKASDEMESNEFYQLTRSLVNRPIMLYGKTKVGKTAALASIIIDWVNGKAPWNKYDMILFIPLSIMETSGAIEDVFDLCLQYLLPKLDMVTQGDYLETSLKNHLIDLGKKHELLILLDDLHLFKTSCWEVTQFFNQTSISKEVSSEMIFSTTINYLIDRNLSNVALLRLKGFTEGHQMDKFLSSHKYSDLSIIKSQREPIADEFLILPGLLKILHELPAYATTSKNKPTNTFNFIVIRVWNDYIEKCSTKFQTKEKWYKQVFIPITKFASQLDTNNKYTFSKEDLAAQFKPSNINNVEDCFRIGWVIATGDILNTNSKFFQFFNRSFLAYLISYALWVKGSPLVSSWKGGKIEKLEQLLPHFDKTIKQLVPKISQVKKDPNDGVVG